MQILAVVKFNDHEAYVLSEKLDLKYTKIDRTIIGTDGVFCDCLFHELPTRYSEAFAGREFTLQLTDGTEEKCNGQWWSGVSSDASIVLGDLVSVTAHNIEALRRCYVFGGYWGIKSEIEKLRAEYDGPVYGYWEFEKMLKAGWVAHNQLEGCEERCA